MKFKVQRVPFTGGLVLALSGLFVPTGCGGAAEGNVATGESHFLTLCTESCPGQLNCISGICTVACVVEEADTCESIFSSAQCTNESIEPGEVAVCDVSCDDDSACSKLGADFSCDDGFCRTLRTVDSDPNVWQETGGLVRVTDPEVPTEEDGSLGLPDGYFQLLGGAELPCLPNELSSLDEVDEPSCGIIEVWLPDEPAVGTDRYTRNCYVDGRHPHHLVSPLSVFEHLDELGLCEDGNGCQDYDICAVNLVERSGDQALIDQCRDATVAEEEIESPGFCLVDPAVDGAGAALVSHCSTGSERTLRPVGASLPSEPGFLMIACGEDLL